MSRKRPRYLTTPQVAALLQVTPCTVGRLEREGWLRHDHRVAGPNGVKFYRAADIDKLPQPWPDRRYTLNREVLDSGNYRRRAAS